MSRPPQYGDVMRDKDDGSLWMLIYRDVEARRPDDWCIIPLTDSKNEMVTALDQVYYSWITDGMEFV